MHGNVINYSCDICQEFYSLYEAEIDLHKMRFHEEKTYIGMEFGVEIKEEPLEYEEVAVKVVLIEHDYSIHLEASDAKDWVRYLRKNCEREDTI